VHPGEYELDLLELFKRTFELLRSNLVLFLPPLVLAYLLPTALALAGLYIFAPILIATANSSAPLSVLVPGSVVAIVAVVILALLGYAYVLAGWTEMNKNTTLAGKTVFNDFWVGTKTYFGRIIAGLVVLGVIYIVLALVGIAATFVVILPLVMRYVPTAMMSGVAPPIPSGLPEISQILAAVGNTVGVWMAIVTLVGLVFLFTVFWVQSAAIDNVGALRALGRSISFVRKNFKTTLGIAALYIIATGFTGAIFPGGGGGGGGGGAGGGYGFSLVIPAPLEAVFRLLITTFFMLYLFVVYVERSEKSS
jgi:magnesium-transporting ATPase (P-type)